MRSTDMGTTSEMTRLSCNQHQEVCMRKILIGLASLAAIAVATPASAQGVYFGAPGVSVGVGVPAPAYRENYYHYDRPRYRVHRYYDDGYAYAPRGCRTVTIRHDDGSVRRIRRCG
jgi:hypothetical protein